MKWEKVEQFKLTHGPFVIHYNTAEELGAACAEIKIRHGVRVPNPYDPVNLEYDEFDIAYADRMDKLGSD